MTLRGYEVIRRPWTGGSRKWDEQVVKGAARWSTGAGVGAASSVPDMVVTWRMKVNIERADAR